MPPEVQKGVPLREKRSFIETRLNEAKGKKRKEKIKKK